MLIEYKRLHKLGPDVFDVERLLMAQVECVGYQLSRTAHICALDSHLAFFSLQGGAASRALTFGSFEDIIRRSASRTLVEIHAYYRRNNLTRFLDDNGIANANIFFGDVILVVQCSAGNCGASQLNRLQLGNRGYNPGTSDLQCNAKQLSCLLFRQELEGGSPARSA